ncbi:MAG: hypothetical protein IJM53_02460 [Lachnospiraceae bacterium]|nr:hypothetical protein [Lachnospiraceae bacterium]
MNERENYELLLKGEQPKWVPYYRDAVDWVIPSVITGFLGTEERIDFFGVKYANSPIGNIADVNYICLDDITKWRDVVHFPDLDSLDWKTLAEKDTKIHDPNKMMSAMIMPCPGGNFFIPLMNMMGFEEGLISMLEEEEEVASLFEHICQFLEKLEQYMIDYYKPDMVHIGDDIASAGSMFISRPTFERLIKPFFKRLINRAVSQGVAVEWHCCGKCESVVDDYVEMGISTWESAQPMNDLDAIKKKYGNRLILNGCWQGNNPAEYPGASEEVVRKAVRETIDRYAVGGGYSFWDGDPVGPGQDMKNKIAWIADEVRKYGRSFYK